MLNNDSTQQNTSTVKFAEEDFLLDAAYALYWPKQSILIISDIHLEKGSYFASVGQPLPVHDTKDTLERIELLISRYQPQHVIALGDNMHDAKALQRMRSEDVIRLETICDSVKHWSWIIGNHDKDDYSTSVISHRNFYADLTIENIIFSHDYLENAEYQIIGHYHPKIKVRTAAQSVSGKCFVVADKKILMPAFGSYTGGLYVDNSVIETIVKNENPKYYLLHQNRIWRVK